jgi:predicted cytidylate kinase
MVIRVSGYPGAGKTTLCKKLTEELGYGYRNGGDIFRAMAAEKKMSIEDFYKSLVDDPVQEKSVDDRAVEIMAANDDLVMEGRVVPFLPCPHPIFNILLMVSPRVGAERDLARPANAGRSVEEMMRQTEERIATEKKHYKTLYNIDDHFNAKHYDLVIDTSSLSPAQVFEKVMFEIKKH